MVDVIVMQVVGGIWQEVMRPVKDRTPQLPVRLDLIVDEWLETFSTNQPCFLLPLT